MREYGYYKDTETGLHLCTYRYYDPSTGRWINRDPIGYVGGLNLYGYCDNNPGITADPSGLQGAVGGVWPRMGIPVRPIPVVPAPSPTIPRPIAPPIPRIPPIVVGIIGRAIGVIGIFFLLQRSAGDPRYDTLPPPQSGKKQTKKSGKEKSTDKPSWSRYYPKGDAESCRDYAERILNDKYGASDPRATARGGGSEYSEIYKECMRNK